MYQSEIIPKHFNQFTCIGTQCEDTCCNGWNVIIDENTFKKYRKIKSPSLKPIIERQVSRVRKGQSNVNYAKIKMNKRSGCPFLTEDKLCGIQKDYGEGYLSNTCAVYPRIINDVNGILERSLSISCPEAARLVLLNTSPLEFDHVPVKTQPRIVNIQLDIAKSSKYEFKYFWELRIFSIGVIQNRNFSLRDRLIVLGLFYKTLRELVIKNEIEQTPVLIAKYKKILENPHTREDLIDIPNKIEHQINIVKPLLVNKLSSSTNKRYEESVLQALVGIGYEENKNEEELLVGYQDAFKKYYVPFMKDHEYIYENYLVNYIYQRMFPINYKDDIFDAFSLLVIHYSMIKLILVGLSAYHKEMNIDLVIKAFQSFSKEIEHNSVYMANVLQYLIDNEMNTMAYMAVLINH